jgi:hypothetical protein
MLLGSQALNDDPAVAIVVRNTPRTDLAVVDGLAELGVATVQAQPGDIPRRLTDESPPRPACWRPALPSRCVRPALVRGWTRRVGRCSCTASRKLCVRPSSVIGQPCVVLGERGRQRARTGDVVELREREPIVELVAGRIRPGMLPRQTPWNPSASTTKSQSSRWASPSCGNVMNGLSLSISCRASRQATRTAATASPTLSEWTSSGGRLASEFRDQRTVPDRMRGIA